MSKTVKEQPKVKEVAKVKAILPVSEKTKAIVKSIDDSVSMAGVTHADIKVAEVKTAEVKIGETPVTMENTFEERVKRSDEYVQKKRELKAKLEAVKKMPIDPSSITNIENAYALLLLEERTWLESIANMLEPEIKKNGFIYKFVKRGEKALIYAQCGKPDPRDPESEKPWAYEVFLSKISTPKIAFKKQYEAYEMFPGNSVFGLWAWACGDMERAEARFALLEKGIEEVESDETANDEE